MITGCDITWREPVLKPYHLDEKPGLSKFTAGILQSTVTDIANESVSSGQPCSIISVLKHYTHLIKFVRVNNGPIYLFG